MTDIESKLSAIKAINEEKYLVEVAIAKFERRQSDNYTTLVLFDVSFPQSVFRKSEAILIEYLVQRKAELIAKAEALMK